MNAILSRLNPFSSDDSTYFYVGKDKFEDVEINEANNSDFWYFKNNKKGLIKKFILKKTEQTSKVCEVTLIKKGDNFTPRFDFSILSNTKKTFENVQKKEINDIPIKAKVSFHDCRENFANLVAFIGSVDGVDFNAESYAVVDSHKKELYENVSKEEAILSLSQKFGDEISEKDITLLQNRREKLDYFKKLLEDEQFFREEKGRLEKTDESLWQYFFESNQWIFGYGLQLVACEGMDDSKLEATVVGNDLLDGDGKRIDALLKTKGNISKFLFCEIKTHKKGLLLDKEYRSGVYTPGKELIGAVAQIQKTIHKVNLKLQENYIRPTLPGGDPTGEEILFVKPRGIVVIGLLDDVKTESGNINYEKLSSFELYRQQMNGVEIITYDELYERVKFIVEEVKA